MKKIKTKLVLLASSLVLPVAVLSAISCGAKPTEQPNKDNNNNTQNPPAVSEPDKKPTTPDVDPNKTAEAKKLEELKTEVNAKIAEAESFIKTNKIDTEEKFKELKNEMNIVLNKWFKEALEGKNSVKTSNEAEVLKNDFDGWFERMKNAHKYLKDADPAEKKKADEFLKNAAKEYKDSQDWLGSLKAEGKFDQEKLKKFVETSRSLFDSKKIQILSIILAPADLEKELNLFKGMVKITKEQYEKFKVMFNTPASFSDKKMTLQQRLQQY
ncbi:hypothetical protein [Mycoplasmopsis alligatoris]|uniref:Lipoprotein n=1 Tax=Mycoplasmopsis alligatoris A21JP2 TaxID=747682 RepID=D4XV15_9BACT|nr:hypothetical protein [Mycoplasmopsis alligatoris]EFF41816.1 hypothetical protein MALL_0173 [Mycoplasmopsis alligatoris A21JP2]